MVWQTGKTSATKYANAATKYSNVWVGAFIAEMDMAYAVADVVISRAGAMSVAEICVVAKPAVFVPYPFAAEDHQTANANYLVTNNADLIRLLNSHLIQRSNKHLLKIYNHLLLQMQQKWW